MTMQLTTNRRRVGLIASGLALLLPAGCGRLPDGSTAPGLVLAQAAGNPVAVSDHAAAGPEARKSLRVASADWKSREEGPEGAERDASRASAPDWAASAVFYQLFPERFRNGDRSNDPTRESLEFPDLVHRDWAPTRWTADWYERAAWERAGGDSFFDNGVFDRRYGGDLQGVLDRLDYLEDLGVNALYLNPVFYARSLHKYDGNTYHHVDPYFGPDPLGDLAQMKAETSDPETWNWTAADRLFLDLVAEAHRRGIRVVLDGVFNHTGRDFFAFTDLVERQADSPYRDWYIVTAFDNPKTPGNEFRYKGWWGVETLPEFADNAAGDDLHEGPKQYVFDATARWMDPDGDGDPSDGIDGWRLDVAAEVPVGFWSDWNAHCRRINPECYTVAEHWDDAARFLADGGFSATMNYHGFAFPVKGFLIDGTLSASDAAKQLVDRMNEFPPARRYAMQNLVDSHDTDRVASMVVNAPGDRPYLRPKRSDYDVTERVSARYWRDYRLRKPTDAERRVQRLVAVMQATFVGAPMIYYGTECGMWGGDDPCDRMPMVWEDLEYDDQAADPLGRERAPDKVVFDKSLHAFYRGVLRLRRGSEALQRGDLEVLLADDPKQVLAFRRRHGDESVVVVFNRGDESAQVRLDGVGRLEPLLAANGGAPETSAASDAVILEMPAVEAFVYRESGDGE